MTGTPNDRPQNLASNTGLDAPLPVMMLRYGNGDEAAFTHKMQMQMQMQCNAMQCNAMQYQTSYQVGAEVSALW